MKPAVVLILLVLVEGGYDFDYSDVKSMEIYANVDANNSKKKISSCVERASRMNRNLRKISELSEELSWTDKAIEHELMKFPDLRNIDPDDLKKTKVYCKVANLTRVYK